MLETMRRNSRSAIIYVLFGILIAVFVLSFGPGSRGVGVTNTQATVAAKIDGATLTEQDFRFAYIAAGGANVPPKMAKEQRLKETVMDLLIERELLAEEARKMGFAVSTKEAEDMVADGRMIVMGRPRRIDAYVYKDGNFDYERFKLVCQNQLGVSVRRFIEIEQRELLAEKAREALRVGVRVSPAEVKSEFEEHGRLVNLEYVRFSARLFEDDELTPKEIADYQKAHEADLKKLYEERKALVYTKLEKQAKLRHVLVEVAKDAVADVVAKAKAKLDEAKKALDGGQTFGDVAKRASTDLLVQRMRGEMGWKKKGFTGLGETLDAKVFAAKKGDVIGPEKTDRGFELVQVVDFREGDVSYEQAAPELAEQELRRDKAKRQAKAEAQAALDRARDKNEKLETLYPVKKDENADDGSPQAKLAALIKGEEPQAKETGLFFRRGDVVQGIGVSKDLAKQAWAMKQDELAGPFEVANSYVVVQLKEKKEPDLKDFDKRRAELEDEAAREKWGSTVKAWATNRCVEVRDAGKIRVNDEIISYEGMAPARPGVDKTAYVPCAPRMMF